MYQNAKRNYTRVPTYPPLPNGEVLGKLDDVLAMVRDKGKGSYRRSSLARSQGTQGGDACSSFEYPSGPPVALSPGFQSAAVVLGATANQQKLERIVEDGSSDEAEDG